MRNFTQTIGTVLLVCLTYQPLAPAAEFAGGTGEPNDPYQIATADQLTAIGSNSDLLGKSFVLVADIDLDPNLPGGRVFTDALIARDNREDVGDHSGTSFAGVFDGRGHTIANLHIDGVHGYDAGLFGQLTGLVKDLRLTDVVISGSPSGAMAGLNHRGGTILRCRVSGKVSGIRRVGGLVGDNMDASLLECQSDVQVAGDNDVGGLVGYGHGSGGGLVRCQVQGEIIGDRRVGGLVGSQLDGPVVECRASGKVIGSDDVGGLIGVASDNLILRCSSDCEVTAEYNAGGLIGNASMGSGPVIADCRVEGSVAGSSVGGLVGEGRRGRTMNCYAACVIIPLEAEGQDPMAGGLFGDMQPAGSRAPMTIACFWDAELSGLTASTSSGQPEFSTGLTTAQMLDGGTFRDVGWDFGGVWTACEGDYPKLKWEGGCGGM